MTHLAVSATAAGRLMTLWGGRHGEAYTTALWHLLDRKAEEQGLSPEAVVEIADSLCERSQDRPEEMDHPEAITYKCHWENEMKPIHTADIYMPKGSRALTDDDLVNIEYWKIEPDGALKKLFKYKLEGRAPVTLSANAQHFAKKLLRGTETFPVAYPVVTKTGVSRVELAFATTMNKWFSSPPGFPKGKFPPEWRCWVGVEDDREQQGRTGPKERGESYRGVRAVDLDFYAPGKPS
jgi:hypothetical protein